MKTHAKHQNLIPMLEPHTLTNLLSRASEELTRTSYYSALRMALAFISIVGLIACGSKKNGNSNPISPAEDAQTLFMEAEKEALSGEPVDLLQIENGTYQLSKAFFQIELKTSALETKTYLAHGLTMPGLPQDTDSVLSKTHIHPSQTGQIDGAIIDMGWYYFPLELSKKEQVLQLTDLKSYLGSVKLSTNSATWVFIDEDLPEFQFAMKPFELPKKQRAKSIGVFETVTTNALNESLMVSRAGKALYLRYTMSAESVTGAKYYCLLVYTQAEALLRPEKTKTDSLKAWNKETEDAGKPASENKTEEKAPPLEKVPKTTQSAVTAEEEQKPVDNSVEPEQTVLDEKESVSDHKAPKEPPTVESNATPYPAIKSSIVAATTVAGSTDETPESKEEPVLIKSPRDEGKTSNEAETNISKTPEANDTIKDDQKKPNYQAELEQLMMFARSRHIRVILKDVTKISKIRNSFFAGQNKKCSDCSTESYYKAELEALTRLFSQLGLNGNSKSITKQNLLSEFAVSVIEIQNPYEPEDPLSYHFDSAKYFATLRVRLNTEEEEVIGLLHKESLQRLVNSHSSPASPNETKPTQQEIRKFEKEVRYYVRKHYTVGSIMELLIRGKERAYWNENNKPLFLLAMAAVMPNTLRHLIDAGVLDIHAKNAKNQTALMLAEDEGFDKFADTIRGLGANQ